MNHHIRRFQQIDLKVNFVQNVYEPSQHSNMDLERKNYLPYFTGLEGQ